MSCAGTSPLPTFTTDDASKAVERVLGTVTCVNTAGANFNIAADAEFGILGGGRGLGGGSGSINGDADYNISRSGCDTVSTLAAAYKISHDSMSCLLQQTRQTNSLVVKFDQEITVRCNHCEGNISSNQTISSNSFTNVDLNNELISEMQQISETFLDNIQTLVNENAPGMLALEGATVAGSSFDSVIADTKTAVQTNDVVQSVVDEYAYAQEAEFEFSYWNGTAILNQEISSQVIATNILSQNLYTLFTQLDEETLKNNMGMTNIDEANGIESIISPWMTIWVVGLLFLVFVVIFIFKGGSDKVQEMMKNMTTYKGLISGLAVVSVLMVAGAVIFAVFSNWVGMAICAVVAIALIAILIYLVKKNKSKKL